MNACGKQAIAETAALWSPVRIAEHAAKHHDPHHFVTTAMLYAGLDLAAAGADENQIRAHRASIVATVNETFATISEYGKIGHG